MTHRYATVEIGCDGPFELLSRRPHGAILRSRVEERIRSVLQGWGLSGEPRCTIRGGALKPLDVRIQGRSIDYPWSTVRRLRAPEWDTTDPATIVAAAADVIEEAIEQNPSAFVSARQAAEYAGDPVTEDRTADSLEILRSLVWLGVPLVERHFIQNRIRKAHEINTRADELVETLFADLRGQVQIHVSPKFLAEVSSVDTDEVDARSDGCVPDARHQLEEVERALYMTSGIQLPDVVWRADPGIDECMMALQVNSHRDVPIQIPDGSLSSALVPGIQTSAHRLLGLQDVESQLAQLQVSAPELVQAVITRVSSTQLARTLREMIRDSLSIRDLRAILDRLLAFETITVDNAQSRICDGRLPVLRGAFLPPSAQYLDFVRHGLKHRLVHDRVEGHLILTLDAGTQTRIETALRRRTWPNERRLRALKDAVGGYMERSGNDVPVTIIVRPTIRWHVRRMLCVEFPEVSVLASTEIPVEVELHSAITLGMGERHAANGAGPLTAGQRDEATTRPKATR